MHDIDLVPADYRAQLAQRGWLRLVGALSAVAVVACLAASAGLRAAARGALGEAAALQLEQTMSGQQRTQLEELDARIEELARQSLLLRGLRSGAPAETMFEIVDRALPAGDVWFLGWRFRRAGVVVPELPRTVATGYFIVVPAGERGAEEDDWQVETHMRINGQAVDHAALSRFVRRLFEQPEVRDVRLQRTALRRYTTASVVDFDLTVVLSSDVGNG